MFGIVKIEFKRDFLSKMEGDYYFWWKWKKVLLLKLKGISIWNCTAFDKKDVALLKRIGGTYTGHVAHLCWVNLEGIQVNDVG